MGNEDLSATFPTGSKAQLAEFTRVLRALPEEVAHSFLDRFQILLNSAVIEFPEGSRVIAPGTRHGGISLRIVGMDELIAAARAAA